MRHPIAYPFSISAALLAATLGAQAETALHSAVDASELVVVARHVGVATHGASVRFHRLEIIEVVKGEAEVGDKVTAVDYPELSLHQRPVPLQTRLYCLRDDSENAAKAGLPTERGPFFRLAGHGGSSPLVIGGAADSPHVRWARIVARAGEERAAITAEAARAVALGEHPELRLEACQFLTQRQVLRDALPASSWNALAGQAVRETEDVGFKIALAEVCAIQGVPGIVTDLCGSVPQIDDPRFVRFLGRAARAVHGEASADLLLGQARSAREPAVRGRFLVAAAATRTETALNALIALREADPEDSAVVDALHAHGSRRAREAATRREK